MSSKKDNSSEIQKSVVQAVVILDTFEEEFRPVTDTVPLALIPLVNKPLIEYTLEFMSLAGVEEAFLFCCTHIDPIKAYIKKCVEETRVWSVTMKVNILASETCCSFGDCLRDIDAKGLIRGDFFLLEPVVISNIKLLPILEEHKKHAKHDKGAAMTLIYQETSTEQLSLYPQEETIVAVNTNKKVLSHRKVGLSKAGKVDFPLELFLENSCVSIHHNFRDTHVAVCSPAVLPLFADNFDFQTKDDFVRGLLINEEILESTLYCHIAKENEIGGAVNNWRMYQVLTWELVNFWMYPIVPSVQYNNFSRHDVVTASGSSIPMTCSVNKCIMGDNVKLGENVKITNSFVLSNVKLEDNVCVSDCFIGEGCVVKANSKLSSGCVLAENVVIEENTKVDGKLIKSFIPTDSDDMIKFSEKAYFIAEDTDTGNESSDEIELLAKQFTKLGTNRKNENLTVFESDFSDSEDETMSSTESLAPDDVKLFFTEVVDSLTRGYEDKLLCDNLILEVNSSRYAYNVTLREVNFNVVRAILHIALKNIATQNMAHLNNMLTYFCPLLKNYIKNYDAVVDCLQATEEVATSYENITGKWVIFILKWLYDKELISEDAILKWYNNLDGKSKLQNQVKPFAEWLSEAEEASSEEESSDD